MKKTIIQIGAFILFILGFISLFSPLPGATIIFACSLALLISVIPYVQFCVQWIRSRVSWINRSMYFLEEKGGKHVKMIRETLPKTHPLEGTEGQKLSHKQYVKAKLKTLNEEEG